MAASRKEAMIYGSAEHDCHRNTLRLKLGMFEHAGVAPPKPDTLRLLTSG